MNKLGKIIGYFVDSGMGPMYMDKEDKLLWNGNYATIFKSRQDAKMAITRSEKAAPRYFAEQTARITPVYWA